MTLHKDFLNLARERGQINAQAPVVSRELSIALEVIEARFKKQQAEFEVALQNIQASKSEL